MYMVLDYVRRFFPINLHSTLNTLPQYSSALSILTPTTTCIFLCINMYYMYIFMWVCLYVIQMHGEANN